MSQSDFVSRGQALVAGGQFQEAVKVCRLGLLGRPTTVEGRVVLGQALLALKRFDEVLAEMRVALELDHTAIEAYLLKAEALLRKNDAHAAIETMQRALELAPDDRHVRELYGEVQRATGAAPTLGSHPSVGYVGSGETKNYPNHQGAAADEDSFTKPTSLAAPGPLHDASRKRAQLEMPSPAELDVGDRSGTVEVDPDLDAVELTTDRDRDFGDVAAPPVANRRPAAIVGDRGQVKLARGDGPTELGKRPSARRPAAPDDFAPKRMEPTVDLDDQDDDDEDLYETHSPVALPPRRRAPGPVSSVRDAVAMPSGPLGVPVPRAAGQRGAQLPPPRGKPPSGPPPHQPATPEPLPPPPRGIAGLPTLAAAPNAPPGHSLSAPTSLGYGGGFPSPPGGPMTAQGFAPAVSLPPGSQPPHLPAPHQPMPMGMPSPASLAASARPTLAISAPPPPQQLMHHDAPNWARATVAAADPRAAAQAPSARPSDLDPGIAALMAGSPVESGAVVALEAPPAKGKHKTGVRRTRSTRVIALWVLVGGLVIGGGVFAGFWIRSMRLAKQIEAARDRATDLAKPDTWAGWAAARDSLAGIAQADGSIVNQAALARARGVIAFEFGDGLAEAKSAAEALGGQGGLDGSIAASYVALALGDARAAKLASDAALAVAAQDAAALYVAGQAALLAGDLKAAVTYVRSAVDHDPRPLYRVGLARTYAAAFSWDEALDVIDRVRSASSDHPAAAIERGIVLATSGRIVPGSTVAADVHAQLERLITEGGRPFGEQQHGVSPEQIALANLSLARVDFARGDVAVARTDVGHAGEVGVEDQAFAEEAIDTLYAIGELAEAKKFAERALGIWPTSHRARITLAEILLAMGRSTEALDTLDKQPEMLGAPVPLAVRGEIRRMSGDSEGARADFDNALKKVPTLEPAVVGLAWLELEAGNTDEAKKLVEPRVGSSPTPAISTVYAAILRRSRDAATRDKAKAMLEKVVAGAQGVDVARAQLELARLDRDLGDFHGALVAYGEASKTGNFEARLETGLLQIENRDPSGGHETLEVLLKEAGDHPSGRLVLEAARARMLVGDHAGATQLIETASKLPDVTKWKLERERGRFALRHGDYQGAILALGKALDSCGSDAESFLLAADAATSVNEKGAAALGDKISKLVPVRLKGQPEAQIVTGKVLLGASKFSEALATFTAARDALDKVAAPLRMAQARFGVAVANYNLKNDAQARSEFDLVIALDPSLYPAYLYLADLLGTREPRRAFELAQKAVLYDPDTVEGWGSVGQLAARLGDRKVLAEAIARLAVIAPGSDGLKQLQALRR